MDEMIQRFQFGLAEIRVRKDKDGEPWFVAKDVCDALGLTNPTVAVQALDEDERTKFNLGEVEVNCINEPGLYTLVMRCRDAVKPGTTPHKFRKWVTGEVLPAIRRQGGYIAAAPNETPEQLYLRAMTSLKAAVDRQQKQIEAQRVQLQIQAPTVEYAETVLSSSTLLTVNTIAVHLGISAKALNLFLCGEDWIYRQGANWYPTAKIRGLGYCDYDTIPYVNSAGEQCTREHLKWTEQGRRAVIELWNRKHNVVGGVA